MDVLEGFDYALGLERLQGNRSLYIKLLHDFSERYRFYSFEVKGALTIRDREKAHQLVHTMKGLAGNLSATDLYEAARSLDKPLNELDPNWFEVEKCYLGFEKALEQAVRSVDGLDKACLKSLDEPRDSMKRTADLPLHFASNIRQSIELGDIMAIIELVDNPAIDKSLQDRITSLVDDLDFDGLSRLADELERSVDRKIRL